MKILDPIKNFAVSDVSQGYTSTDTVIDITYSNRFPDPALVGEYNLVWFNYTDYPEVWNDPNVEIVRVIAKNGNLFTIVRGQEGTTPTDKNMSGKTYRVILSLTEKTINDIDNIIAKVGYDKTRYIDEFLDINNAITNITTDSILVINKTIDLGGQSVTIPENITLEFQEGGKFTNGSLIIEGNIMSNIPDIFDTTLTVNGTQSKVVMASADWFGAKGEGISDDGPAIQKALESFKTVFIPPNRTYVINTPIIIHATRRTLYAYNAILTPGNTFPAGSHLIEFSSDTVTNTFLWVYGLRIKLENANGLKIEGMHQVFLKDIRIEDTQSASVNGVDIINCFNVYFYNPSLHSINSTESVPDSTKNSKAINIIGDANRPRFQYITNLAIEDGLIHGWNYGIYLDNTQATSYSTNIEIRNCAINNTTNNSIDVNGFVAALELKHCHFEITGDTVLRVNNTTKTTTVKVSDCSVWNTSNVFDLIGNGSLKLTNNRFHGSVQSPKYNLFKNNDFNVQVLDEQSIYSTTYSLLPVSGTGSVTYLYERKRYKTAAFNVSSADDHITFSNRDATGTITANLPRANSVPAGFKVKFIVESPNLFVIKPDANDTISPISFVAGERIKTDVLGSSVTLVSDGNSNWNVESNEGFGQEHQRIILYDFGGGTTPKPINISDGHIWRFTGMSGNNTIVRLPLIANTKGKEVTIINGDYQYTLSINYHTSDNSGSRLFVLEPGEIVTLLNDGTDWKKAPTKKEIRSYLKLDLLGYRLSDYASLQEAITDIGSANTKLIVDRNENLNLSSVTVPENVDLEFIKGNLIENGTLTINGGIIAGLYQIFGSNLTVAGNPKITEVYPEWFGAKGDGVTDDTQAIQSAINFSLLHQIDIYFSKHYKLSKPIYLGYNSTENPINISDDRKIGRVKIKGKSINLKPNIDNSSFVGAVIQNDNGAVFIQNDDVNSYRNRGVEIENLLLKGNGNYTVYIKGGFQWQFKSLTIQNIATTGDGILLEDCDILYIKDLWIFGNSDTNRTNGTGFIHKNINIDTSENNINNIRVYYFTQAYQIGDLGDATGNYMQFGKYENLISNKCDNGIVLGDRLWSNVFINCQFRGDDNVISIQGRNKSTLFINSGFQQQVGATNPIVNVGLVGGTFNQNSIKNIKFLNCNFNSTLNNPIFKLNNNIDKRIDNISVENCRIFVKGGYSTPIFSFNSNPKNHLIQFISNTIELGTGASYSLTDNSLHLDKIIRDEDGYLILPYITITNADDMQEIDASVSTTITVPANGNLFKMLNGGTTPSVSTIDTARANGVSFNRGDNVEFFCEGNITFEHGTGNIILKSGANITTTYGTIKKFIYHGGSWYEAY